MTEPGRRSTPTVAAAGFRLLNQAVSAPVKAGFASPGPIGPGIVVLETIGRRSGLPRQVPLAAVRVGERLIVSTVRGNSRWLSNLEADPSAQVWSCGESTPVTARVYRGALNVAVLDPA
jgi:deazaflavin-dependent oxidoreductase (nitroreductase family)